MNGTYSIAKPANEPALGYAPGSREKRELKARLAELSNTKLELPLLIGGREIRTGTMGHCIAPHDHRHVHDQYKIRPAPKNWERPSRPR